MTASTTEPHSPPEHKTAGLWVFAGLVGVTLAVTVALKQPVPGLPAAGVAFLAVAAGWIVMLAFAPWRSVRTMAGVRRDIRRLTADLDRINAGERDHPISEVVLHRDDELGALSRAVRETLVQAETNRQESRRLQRTMEDAIKRETGRATFHLQREAHTDPLTGLGNRRRMDRELAKFFGTRRRRQHDTIVAMLIDLDRFKAINDTLGHEVGDACLSFLGRLLASTVRSEDCPIRLGGDEFAIIMPSQTVDEAEGLAERICSLFRQMPWPHRPMHRPTLSVGIAVAWTGEAGGAEALLRRADRALYEAKDAGRDTVRAFLERRSVA